MFELVIITIKHKHSVYFQFRIVWLTDIFYFKLTEMEMTRLHGTKMIFQN